MHHGENTILRVLSRCQGRLRDDQQGRVSVSARWTGANELCLGRFVGPHDALLVNRTRRSTHNGGGPPFLPIPDSTRCARLNRTRISPRGASVNSKHPPLLHGFRLTYLGPQVWYTLTRRRLPPRRYSSPWFSCKRNTDLPCRRPRQTGWGPDLWAHRIVTSQLLRFVLGIRGPPKVHPSSPRLNELLPEFQVTSP